jgi:hypothetical protein
MELAADIRGGHSVFLTATCARRDLAAPVLSQHLGIPQDEALARLANAPSRLAAGLSPQRAERLAAILATLGLSVSLEVARSSCFDLSAQLAVWADAEKIAARLSPIVDRPPQDVARALGNCGGLILEGLDADTATTLSAHLGRLRGLVVTLSDRATALYDIYATRPLFDQEASRLAAVSSLLGTRRDGLTDAVATGLDRRNLDQLMSRLPDLDLIALDRAFQRFDLVLTGVTGWTDAQLADFLAARTHKPRAAFEMLSPSEPVKLDLGLKLHVARQFCADYAAIGLMVRPILSTRGRNA